MSDSYAPVHHITTSDVPTNSTTQTQTQVPTQTQTERIEPTSTSSHQQQQQTTALPDLSEVSSNDATARRESLVPTPNPTARPGDVAAVTTDEASKDEIPPYSAVSSQNAPGKVGAAGENIMGALGYGGSKVERPKEDQGLGEKIVNFLGV